MARLSRWALLGTGVLVTLPLLWFGLRPEYMVQVIVQPSSEVEAQIISKEVWTVADGNGIVFFDFKAIVASQASDMLILEIRPAAEREYRRQGNGYRVVRGILAGVAQLGAADWPVHQDEQYAFRLVTGNAAVVLDGRMLAKVYPRSTLNPWIMAAIGALASVLEVLKTFVRVETPNNQLQRTSAA